MLRVSEEMKYGDRIRETFWPWHDWLRYADYPIENRTSFCHISFLLRFCRLRLSRTGFFCLTSNRRWGFLLSFFLDFGIWNTSIIQEKRVWFEWFHLSFSYWVLQRVRTLVSPLTHLTWHQTPLHEAAKMGRLDLVEFLLQNGADPKAVDVRCLNERVWVMRGSKDKSGDKRWSWRGRGKEKREEKRRLRRDEQNVLISSPLMMPLTLDSGVYESTRFCS